MKSSFARRLAVSVSGLVMVAASLVIAPPAQAATGYKNGLILFVQRGDIWTINPTTAKQKRLTRTGNNAHPAWSPDGKQIAFASNRAGNWDIYIMPANGRTVSQVTVRTSNEEEPTWSPDGRQLAFISDRTDTFHPNLFRISAIAPYGPVTELTWAGTNMEPPAEKCDQWDYYQDPHWSPLGDKILVSHDCGFPNEHDEWVLETRDPVTGVLGDSLLGLGRSSTWAPKGDKIAYENTWNWDDDGNSFITRINADGTGDLDLTDRYDLDVSTSNPVWSPDGRLIAYWQSDGYTSTSGLWTMRPDGANKHLVAFGIGAPSSWQRLTH